MANDYIDQWDLNTVVYDIHDKGRGQPNGVATLDASSKVPDAQLGRGLANGVASLDSNGRIPYEQLPEEALTFKGYWDADTNSPTLVDGTGTSGDFYFVSIAGTQDLGSGSQYFAVGDRVLYDGSIWKNIASGSVRTINGQGPDTQGDISGIVKSVNNVAPDANGNCTLTAMLSVNGVNPDANGNIKIGIKGTDKTEAGTRYRYEGTPYTMSDANWNDFVANLRNCVYVSLYLNGIYEVDTRQSPASTEVVGATYIIAIPILFGSNYVELYALAPSVLEDKSATTVYGWIYDKITIYKTRTNFSYAYGQMRIPTIKWSNTYKPLYYLSSEFDARFCYVKASNS